jgi:hypothetical protein
VEIYKIFETYPPIRPFFAAHLNSLSDITIDLRRFPDVDKKQQRTVELREGHYWFDRLNMLDFTPLERMYNITSVFMEDAWALVHTLIEIVQPVMHVLNRKPRGAVLNIYGSQIASDFFFELFSSLYSVVGKTCMSIENHVQMQAPSKQKSFRTSCQNEDDTKIIISKIETVKRIYQYPFTATTIDEGDQVGAA